MSLSHFLLALLVVFIWGSNFVVIAIGLNEFPPLFLAALRFIFSVIPWFLFIKRPAVPLKTLFYFGGLIGGGQFGLLFIAMRADISPGLASVLIQSQAFFTILIYAFLLKSRLKNLQIAAISIAFVGYMWIAYASFSDHTHAITITGFILVLLASLSWTACNFIIFNLKRHTHANINMLGFMVWSSAFAAPIVLSLSLIFEDHSAILLSLQQAHYYGWLAAIWQGVGNTLFGFGIWYWLITRYPVSTISPLSLLVPVFGFASSILLLGEPFEWWKLFATACILLGLGLNILATRRVG